MDTESSCYHLIILIPMLLAEPMIVLQTLSRGTLANAGS